MGSMMVNVCNVFQSHLDVGFVFVGKRTSIEVLPAVWLLNLLS